MLTTLDDPDRQGALSHASHMREDRSEASDDPDLRCINAMQSYCIEATDSEIRRVKGFLIEEGTRALRHLIAKTGHWWSGHQVFIVPTWIRAVSWLDRTINVFVTRHQIKSATAYDAALLLERMNEEVLFAH